MSFVTVIKHVWTEQGTGVQRVQSFKAGSIDSGLVVRQGFVVEGVCDKVFSAYPKWGAERRQIERGLGRTKFPKAYYSH